MGGGGSKFVSERSEDIYLGRGCSFSVNEQMEDNNFGPGFYCSGQCSLFAKRKTNYAF